MDHDRTTGSAQRDSHCTNANACQQDSRSPGGVLLTILAARMRLLDCGCGLGNITVGLAQVVAPGEVVGVDADHERIEQARVLAQERGLINTTFQVGDAYDLPFPAESFDAAFVHILFIHLKEPVEAARELHRVLKPAGVLGAREADHDGWIWGGAPEEFREVRHFIDRWQLSRGTDYFFGKRLPSVLQQVGFGDIVVTASHDVDQPPRRQVLAMLSDPDALDFARSEGLDPSTVFPKWRTALEEWASQPVSFTARAEIEAVGWKA